MKAGGPPDAALAQFLQSSAQFRQEAASFLKKTFPDVGFQVPTESYHRDSYGGPAATLFNAGGVPGQGDPRLLAGVPNAFATGTFAGRPFDPQSLSPLNGANPFRTAEEARRPKKHMGLIRHQLSGQGPGQTGPMAGQGGGVTAGPMSAILGKRGKSAVAAMAGVAGGGAYVPPAGAGGDAFERYFEMGAERRSNERLTEFAEYNHEESYYDYHLLENFWRVKDDENFADARRENDRAADASADERRRDEARNERMADERRSDEMRTNLELEARMARDMDEEADALRRDRENRDNYRFDDD